MRGTPGRSSEWLWAVAALGCSDVAHEGHGVASRTAAQTGAQVISAELDTPGLPRRAPIAMTAYGQQASFGRSSYLSAFTRLEGGVFAARVSSGGTLLDPHGILIADDQAQAARPIYTGEHWLAIFGIETLRPEDGFVEDLRCARVLDDGTVLDPGGQQLGLTPFTGHGQRLHAAYNGSQIVLVGERNNSAFVVSDDCVLEREPFEFAPDLSSQSWSAANVASNGTDFLLVYTHLPLNQTPRLYAQTIAPGGSLVGSALEVASAIERSSDSTAPIPAISGTVLFDGSQWLVVYLVDRLGDQATNEFFADLRYRTISSSGTLGAEQALTTTLATAWRSGQRPSAAIVEGGFVVAIPEGYVKVAGPTVTTVSSAATGTILDTDGQRLLVEPSLANDALYLMAPDLSLQSSTPRSAFTLPESELCPRVVSNGDAYLVLWQTTPDTGYRAARVSRSGAPLDAEPFAVPGALRYSQLASNGTDYALLAENSAFESTLHRITRDGVVLEGTPLPFSAYGASLASNGADYLVVGTSLSGLLAVRVSRDGDLLDTVPFSILDTGQVESPRMTYDGEQYVIVYMLALDTGDRVMEVTRVTHSGDVLGRTRHPIPAHDCNCLFPRAIASDGEGSLFVWAELDDEGGAVRVARLDRNGALLDPAGVTVGSGSGNADDGIGVVWDGTNYIVSWTARSSENRRHLDLFLARVTPTGQLLDPGGVLVQDLGRPAFSSVLSACSDSPSMAASARQALLAYSRFDDRDDFGAHRVKLRLLEDPATGVGGSAGEGGSGATAGVGGASGSAGAAGGAGATGGAASGGAAAGAAMAGASGEGAAGSSGAPAGGADGGGSETDGCSCRLPSSRTGRNAYWLATLASSWLVLRKRRRTRAPKRR